MSNRILNCTTCNNNSPITFVADDTLLPLYVGIPASFIIGLNSVGSIDESFIYGTVFNNNVNTLSILTNYGNYNFSYYYIDDVSVYLCDSTVGLNEETISELVLYPNPSRDIVKLKTRNNTLLNGKVNVSNTLGGIMFRYDLSNLTELEIDISKWSNGIYYLTFESVYGSIRRMKMVKGN
jgi:hypothetical protein